MKPRNLFNKLTILFCALVPLLSMKYKFHFIPISADFILGGFMIVTGFIALVTDFKNSELPGFMKNNKMRLLTLLILLFVALSFFSYTYARTKTPVITESLRFLEYVLIFYLMLALTDRTSIDRCINVFYGAMILASLYGVIQFVFNLSAFTAGGFWGRGRSYATFVNPNYWGAAVNLVIFYPIIHIIEKKNIKQNIALLILFFFNLFMTSTRGSWIGFGLALLAMGFIRYRKMVYVSIGLFVSMVVLPITRHRFLQILNISERFKLWRTGILMFQDYKLRGVGNGNYIFEYKHYVYWHKKLFLGRTQFSLHNSYLKMFVELGVFGGILFLSIYLLLFKMVYDLYAVMKQHKQWTLAFICFGFSYLVQNLSNNLMFIPQLNVFVWMMSALLLKSMYYQDPKYFQK